MTVIIDISFAVYVTHILSRIFVEVVFETLNGCPDVTFMQMFRLKLGPHVGQLIVRDLVVEEKIEKSLPTGILQNLFVVGFTHPMQCYQELLQEILIQQSSI